MPERDQRHSVDGRGTKTKGRRRWPRRLVVLLVLLGVAAGAAQWRSNLITDTARKWGILRPEANGPAAVAPPPGLRLPAQSRPATIAAQVGAQPVNPAAVARALTPYVKAKALGKHVAVLVADLDGRVVYRHGTSAPMTPASTAKLLTGTAVLQALGPMTRFSTTVHRTARNRIVLVGGGDPFLMSTPKQARGLYPHRATTAELARRTAAALRAKHVTRVRLGYDASLFKGPAVNPQWPRTYIPEDVVPPISALWVNEGAGGNGYVSNPPRAAAQTFAAQLRADGIKVAGKPASQVPPPASATIATVRSAPVGEIVQRTLEVSDNNAAEVLARHVGVAVRGNGSFTGASTAIRNVLISLGVPVAGMRLYDGSGLSRKDRIPPAILLDVLKTDVAPEHGRLREVISGLPIAGFSGSLAFRYTQTPTPGHGRVRAKTGTLTDVSNLAGIAVDEQNTPMLFAVMADRIKPNKTLQARTALDRITSALGTCHCRASGSRPAGTRVH